MRHLPRLLGRRAVVEPSGTLLRMQPLLEHTVVSIILGCVMLFDIRRRCLVILRSTFTHFFRLLALVFSSLAAPRRFAGGPYVGTTVSLTILVS